jgi:dihydrofolate reductase
MEEREFIPARGIHKTERGPGRNILIHESASIVQTRANPGLIDTYQLLVYPVILGSGVHLAEGVCNVLEYRDK